MMNVQTCLRLATTLICFMTSTIAQADLYDKVTHGYADNNGVKIHYVTIGEGPPVVMIHGFPDFWYSWRAQMKALQNDFQVIAIDQRGYNKSDQPSGVENYAMPHLVSDVASVIRHLGHNKATIVGHDWGGAVAWQFALNLPQMTERLVVLNLPHPNGLSREMRQNPQQRANSAYARRFREGSPDDPDILFGGPMNAENLSGWVADSQAKARYIQAFNRSSFSGMLNFYKANFPSGDSSADAAGDTPRLGMPVLVFHGLKDTALLSDGLNNTWDWIDADLTIVTAPEAGHFVQNDAPELVSQTMKWWLLSRL